MKSYFNDELEFQRLMVKLNQAKERDVELTVVMGPTTIMTVVSQMQLALRYPGNQGSLRRRARQFVKALLVALSKHDSELAHMLSAGFPPEGNPSPDDHDGDHLQGGQT